MKRYLIGTSLSMCIGDIAKGKVSEEHVALIVTGTKHSFESGPDWDEMYLGTFKDEVKVVAMEIVDRLWKQGRIHQPREVSSWYDDVRNEAEQVLPSYKRHWYRLSPADSGEDI